MRRILIGVVVAWCAVAQETGHVGEHARAALAAGKSEEALALYREAVRAAPGDSRTLLGLSIAEYQTKRFADSIQHATAALRANPNLQAANVFIGGSYLELGEAGKSVAPLRSALVSMPADSNAITLLARALFSLTRYEEAQTYFERSVKLQPTDPRGWFGLGQVHEALARQIADEIRAAKSESAEAYAVMGYEDLGYGHFAQAFAAFRRALEIDPKLPGVHTGLADVYRNTGHLEWAHYERQFETGGNRDDSYGRYLAHRHGQSDAYERLAQLPPSLEWHLHQAQSLESSASHAEAAREWREALKLAPGNLQAELGLAWSLFRRRDYEPVIQLADAMLRRNPSSVDSNFLYGAALMNLENPDAAFPFLRRAVATDDRFLPAQAALGQALLQTGKASEAIPHLSAALSSDQDGSLHFQLARAYRLSGHTNLAETALLDFQKLRADRDQALANEERIAITAPVREP